MMPSPSSWNLAGSHNTRRSRPEAASSTHVDDAVVEQLELVGVADAVGAAQRRLRRRQRVHHHELNGLGLPADIA